MKQSDIDVIRLLTNAFTLLQRGEVIGADDLIGNFDSSGNESAEVKELLQTTKELLKLLTSASKFITALSQGNLEVEPPAFNFIISPFKLLRSNLLHLTWQAEQIAKGDLSQRVDFMGDFADAFNAMIESLRQKKLIESDLAKSEEKYRNLFENLQDIFFKLTYDGTIQMVSPSVENVLGFSINEIMGRNLTEFYISTDEILNFYKALSTSSNSTHWESQIYNKSGNTVWLSTTAKIIRNTEGSIAFIEAISRDITTSKMFESALRESELKYRTVIERSLSGIIIIQDWLIKFMNPALSEMIGYSLDEAIEIPFSLFVAPEEVMKIREIHENRLYGRSAPEHYETILIHKSGRRIFVDIKSGIMDYKSYPAVLASIHDITELKLSELAYIESEQKLRKSQSEKDKFLSIIAHDLRNPFNVLLNGLNTLYCNFDNLDTDTQKSLVHEVFNTTRNTYQLLENLLLWSRSQRGLLVYYPEKIDLYEFAFNASFEMESKAKEKGINFIVDVKPNTMVIADRFMIQSIIRNFISNAIKFTGKGGEVKVNTIDRDDFLELSVQDTGIGISPDNLSKMFNISETVSTEGTNGETGTGLGLLICKEFIERHSEALFVESEPGKGTTFRFTLKKA